MEQDDAGEAMDAADPREAYGRFWEVELEGPTRSGGGRACRARRSEFVGIICPVLFFVGGV